MIKRVSNQGRKLLSIVLAGLMVVSIVNLNANTIRAEENEPGTVTESGTTQNETAAPTPTAEIPAETKETSETDMNVPADTESEKEPVPSATTSSEPDKTAETIIVPSPSSSTETKDETHVLPSASSDSGNTKELQTTPEATQEATQETTGKETADPLPTASSDPETTEEHLAAPMMRLSRSAAAVPEAEALEPQSVHILEITYEYADGSYASDIKDIQLISSPTTVDLDQKDGYTTYLSTDMKNPVKNYTVSDISADQSITVIYFPNEVQYLVKHAFETRQPDGSYSYMVDDSRTETKTALTGDYTNAVPLSPVPDGYYVNGVVEQTLIEPQILVGLDSFAVTINYDLIEYNLVFNTNGGIAIPAVMIKHGETHDLTGDVPVRAGYVFEGWYDNAECAGNPVTSVTVGLSDVMVYAKWTAQTPVSYTVSYWKEPVEATDVLSDYLYVGSSTANTELAGTVIDPAYVASKGLTDATSISSDMGYFTYDASKTATVTVAGDGSTIVNLYYKRNSYTLAFYMDKATAAMNWNNQSWTDTNVYKFTARYEQSVNGLWPSSSTNITSGDDTSASGWAARNFENSFIYVSNRITLVKEMIKDPDPSVVTEFRVNWETTGRTFHLHYLFNDIDDTAGCAVGNAFDAPTSCYNGKHYTETSYTQTVYSASGNWAAKALEGVTNVYTTPNDQYVLNADGSIDIYFLYDRNTYTIQFYNVDTMLTTTWNAVYGDTLSNLIKKNQGLPNVQLPVSYSMYPDAYQNDQWCTYNASSKETCAVPVSAVTDSIIKTNRIFYYHWKEIDLNVTFKYQDGKTSDTTESVLKGATASAPLTPVNTGFIFVGWYTAPTGGEKFSFQTKINENTTLYAHWVKLQYVNLTVKYIDVTDSANHVPMLGETMSGETTSTFADVVTTVKAKIFDGYYVDKAYKSITPTVGGANLIEFDYQKIGDAISYTVIHQRSTDGKILKTENGSIRAASVIAYADQDLIKRGYTVDKNSDTIIMTTDAKLNTVTFMYTPVQHNLSIHAAYAAGQEGSMTDLPNGDGWTWLGTSSAYSKTFGTDEEYMVPIPPIAGYSIRIVGGAENISRVEGTMPNSDVSVNVEYYIPSTPVPTPTPTATPSEDKDKTWCVTFLDCKGNTVSVQWVKQGGSAVVPTGFGTYTGYSNVTSHRDLRPINCEVQARNIIPDTLDDH